jgi:hypothetical protein
MVMLLHCLQSNSDFKKSETNQHLYIIYVYNLVKTQMNGLRTQSMSPVLFFTSVH